MSAHTPRGAIASHMAPQDHALLAVAGLLGVLVRREPRVAPAV